MRLLKLTIDGLPLFRGKMELDFVAKQKVREDDAENMYNIFNNVYQNNVVAITGMNASGKTSVLKALTFAMGMLKGQWSVNDLPGCEIFDELNSNKEVVFESYIYEAGSLICQKDIIKRDKKGCYVAKEILNYKTVTRSTKKKEMYSLGNMPVEMLLRDRRYETIVNTYPVRFISTLEEQPLANGHTPKEWLALFDPRIEYLHIEGDAKVKFYGKEEIVVPRADDLDRYLSAGTMRGIKLLRYLEYSMQVGGYLIVDDLENHFNKEIVASILRFYMDRHVNKNGATLIFSTHRSELLDEFDRRDNIYIARNEDGITLQNMADAPKLKGVRKSELYDSDFLEGTTPLYDSHMAEKRRLQKFKER